MDRQEVTAALAYNDVTSPPDFSVVFSSGEVPGMALQMPLIAPSWFRFPRLAGTLCALGVAGLLFSAWALTRADEIGRDGLFITVPNPITENAVSHIKQQVQDAVDRQGR